MRLYLIRHGQTAANRDKFFYNDADNIPLTEKGREQAMQIRPLLEKFKFVFT